MNKYQVLVSICLHLDGISTHLSPLVRSSDGLWMALPEDLFFVVDINLVSSRLLRWPERVEWSHLGLTVLRSSIV